MSDFKPVSLARLSALARTLWELTQIPPKQSAGSQKIALTNGRHAAMLPLARLELRAMSALSLQHAAKQTSRRGYNGALTYLKHCGHF